MGPVNKYENINKTTHSAFIRLSTAATRRKHTCDETHLCNTTDVYPARDAFLFKTLLHLPWIIEAESSINFFRSFLNSILWVFPTVADKHFWSDNSWLKPNKSIDVNIFHTTTATTFSFCLNSVLFFFLQFLQVRADFQSSRKRQPLAVA